MILRSDETAVLVDVEEDVVRPDVIDLRADHDFGRHLLIAALARMAAAGSMLDWHIRRTDDPVDWNGDEHALALCMRPGTRRSPIGVALPSMPLGLYASPDYLAREGEVVMPAWFAGRRILDVDFGQSQRSWLLTGGMARIETRVPAETRTTPSVHEALRFAVSGRGLAWLPPMVVVDDLRRGVVRPAMPGAWHRLAPPVHLCLPHRRKPSREMLALSDQLVRMLRAATAVPAVRRASIPGFSGVESIVHLPR